MTDPNHIAEARKKASRPQIREVFLRNGAVIPADRDDLPDWVYESVFELLDSGVIQQAGSAIQYATPAVQGEPVGEVRFELGAPSSIFAELYSKSLPVLAPGTKLYPAPQPAEQQSDITQLVEALEKIAAFQPKDILCGSGWKEWNRAGEYAASIARDALAAHRKGGE